MNKIETASPASSLREEQFCRETQSKGFRNLKNNSRYFTRNYEMGHLWHSPDSRWFVFLNAKWIFKIRTISVQEIWFKVLLSNIKQLYSKPLREFRKPKSKLGDRVCISKYDIPIRMGFKPQFTQEVFELVAIFSRKPPIYTKKDKQDEFIHGKFHQNELMKVI